MAQIRIIFRLFFAAILLSAFALPSLAQSPEKVYSLKMSVDANGSTATVTATFKNETPSGNSSINSLTLIAPTGWLIQSVVSVQNGTAGPTTGGVASVSVTNMSPVKPGKTWTMQVTATSGTASGGTCATVSGNWDAATWTGSSLSGNTFRRLPPPLSNVSTSIGPNCKYSLTPETSFAAGATGTLSISFKHLGASTDPSINSLTLTGTGLTINSVPLADNPNVSANVNNNIVTVTAMPALTGGTTFVLILNVTAAPSCVDSSGTWNAIVYSGASPSGSAFTRDPAQGPYPTTTIAKQSCSLSFSPNPPESGVVSAIEPLPPVTVNLTGGTGNGVGVKVTSNCFSGEVSVVAAGGAAIFEELYMSQVSDVCTLTATAEGYGVATSGAFKVFAAGPLQCEPADPFFFEGVLPTGVTKITQPGYAEGQRGQYNKDGSQCNPVGYTFTNNILSSDPAKTNSVTLVWDTDAQKGAAFRYTVTWKPEFVNATTGLPARTTKVAWGGGALVPGRACLDPDLPFPYGTLGRDTNLTGTPLRISATTSPITVNALFSAELSAELSAPTEGAPATAMQVTGLLGVLPKVPFPIVIDNERMSVTNVSGSTWTVVRGTGGTSAATHAVNAELKTPVPAVPFPIVIDDERMTVTVVTGSSWTVTRGVGGTTAAEHPVVYADAVTPKNVMSTPLPLDSSSPPKQMQMCIAEEGWTGFARGIPLVNDCTTPTSATVPQACVIYSTTVFDIGDGTVSRGGL